jgi:hypothetical protein
MDARAKPTNVRAVSSTLSKASESTTDAAWASAFHAGVLANNFLGTRKVLEVIGTTVAPASILRRAQ